MTITPHLLVAALVMALFSSALPYAFEIIALTGMPIRVYGTCTSLDPALATLMGLLVLRELPSRRSWRASRRSSPPHWGLRPSRLTRLAAAPGLATGLHRPDQRAAVPGGGDQGRR